MKTKKILSEEEISVMAHALGSSSVRSGKPIGFRNYFCAAKGGDSHALLMGLVKSGHMEKGETINGGKSQIYHVTELGIGALVMKGYTVKLS